MTHYETAIIIMWGAVVLTGTHIVLNRLNNGLSSFLALVAVISLSPWLLSFMGVSIQKMENWAWPGVLVPGAIAFPIACLASLLSLVLGRGKTASYGGSIICLLAAFFAGVLSIVFLVLSLGDLD